MNLRKKINYLLKGMGSILEISPPRNKLEELFSYYSAKTPEEQDAQALASDWKYIRKDLEYAVQRIKKELNNEN